MDIVNVHFKGVVSSVLIESSSGLGTLHSINAKYGDQWIGLNIQQTLPIVLQPGLTRIDFSPVDVTELEILGWEMSIIGVLVNIPTSISSAGERLNNVEDELDVITNAFQITPNDVFLPAHTLSVRKVVNAQEGHGQFIDAPSIAAGYPNQRNGIVRFYCIDTIGYIEIEAPDSILQNRKVYLQDRPGKLAVEDTSGFIDAGSGFSVNGVPVVGGRQPSIGIPNVPAFSEATPAGYGWKSDTEMVDFINFLTALQNAVSALRDALVAHGLIGS